MTTAIHIDFETRSTVDLKKAGLDVYARHPSTDVHCMAWAFDEEPPELWSRYRGGYCGDMLDAVAAGTRVVSHNAPFELAIWNHIMVPRCGWPPLKIEQTFCTLAMTYAMALPGDLERAAAALGLDMQKDMVGNRIMKQLMRPRDFAADGSPIWWMPEDAPEKFERLYAYCKQDVVVEREAEKRLLPLSLAERRLWLLDQKINNRGVAVDVDAARKAIELVAAEKKRLDEEMRVVTGNAVATCTATGQLTQWLRWRGCEVASVAKADVLDMLALASLPDDCRRALLLRQEAAKSSTAKFATMIDVAAVDGRARGMFQYHGAGTGRWAGRKIQLQNLPRPKLSQDEIDGVFEALGGA